MESYVLDTSALIALRCNERGADQVEEILLGAKSGKTIACASFISFMEVLYSVWRSEGKGPAIESYLQLKALPLERVDVSEELILLAGEIKASNSLSLADSWVAATAIQRKAVLVHKDPEFEQLKGRITLQPLPYK